MGFFGSGGDILPHRNATGSGVTASSDSSLTIAGTDAIINKAQTATWTGAHVWDSEDNGTTSVPSLLSVQHRNNAAGTPAAGYGVGILMKLDSSARTLRSAVELDAVWSTATDAAEVSSLAIKTLLAGVATETVRFGTGAALPDSDFDISMGRCLFNSRSTDIAYFSHRDMTTTSNYGIFQNSAGATRVNCASGQTLGLYHNNVIRLTVNTTGLGFFSATPVAASTGWAAITNPVSRKTFDTTTVTLPQLAEFVGTLSEFIKTLGLITT